MVPRFPAVLLCSLGPVLVFAQPTAAPPSSLGSPPAVAPTAPPLLEISHNSLPGMLQRAVSGERVIAVGYGGPAATYPEEAVAQAGKLLAKLQAISEAASTDEDALIPYLVGNAWVIAPESREEVRLGATALSPLELSQPQALLETLLGSLSREQLRRLGSPQGIPATHLGADQQAMLARALRPPLQVTTDGAWDEGAPVLRDPIDLSRIRLRAGLESSAAWSYRPGGGMEVIPLPAGETGAGLCVNAGQETDRPSDAPDVASVPNSFKPSDLDGRSFSERFGKSGVMTVDDAVKQLAAVTRLRMTADLPFRKVPVFLGTPDLTCGEVIDGLRLGLTGAWRKLGDTYILAWDRRGLGAVQRLMAEQRYAAAVGAVKRLEDALSGAAVLAMAEEMPFLPESPIRLTDEQRGKVLAPSDGLEEHAPRIPFAEMTSDQQALVRQLGTRGIVSPASGETYFPTEEDFRSVSLVMDAQPRFQAQVPGYGWLPLTVLGSTHHSIRSWSVENARRRAAGKPVLDPYALHLRKQMQDAKPQPLPIGTRALVLPLLPPARTAEALRRARRKGFDTVFYPALFDGYASFPTATFPLHPSLKGQDGWAPVAAAARKQGMRLVGTVDVLSWRREGSKVHWLSKHPEWLDVDSAGRSRLAWLTEHPDALRAGYVRGDDMSPAADCVRPDEPAVEQRLRALIVDLTKQPNVDGIAFADWRPGFGGISASEYATVLGPPALGFNVPQRLAAFRKTGRDPVDAALDHNYSPKPFLPRVLRNSEPEAAWDRPSDPSDAWCSLTDRLLKAARQARPDWATYVLQDGREVVPEPRAEANPRPGGSPFRPSRPQDKPGWLVPIRSADRLAPPERYALDGRPSIVLEMSQWKDKTSPGLILLDFRDAPEEIGTSLDWILPTPA